MDRRVLDHKLLAILILPVLLTACFTGQRARLMTELTTTGDQAIDAVLTKLESVSGATFTASYDATNAFSGATTAVTIAQAAPDRRVTIVGDVTYVVDGDDAETCMASTDTCENKIDPARTSDVQLTPDFYATSAAAHLRAAANIATGPAVASTEVVLEQPATCVAIPVPDDTVTTCVLDDGLLARRDASDVDLAMTAYSPDADDELWP
jgi:hypothetical protein